MFRSTENKTHKNSKTLVSVNSNVKLTHANVILRQQCTDTVPFIKHEQMHSEDDHLKGQECHKSMCITTYVLIW